jgi:hypothetical protein
LKSKSRKERRLNHRKCNNTTEKNSGRSRSSSTSMKKDSTYKYQNHCMDVFHYLYPRRMGKIDSALTIDQ